MNAPSPNQVSDPRRNAAPVCKPKITTRSFPGPPSYITRGAPLQFDTDSGMASVSRGRASGATPSLASAINFLFTTSRALCAIRFKPFFGARPASTLAGAPLGARATTSWAAVVGWEKARPSIEGFTASRSAWSGFGSCVCSFALVAILSSAVVARPVHFSFRSHFHAFVLFLLFRSERYVKPWYTSLSPPLLVSIY